MVNNGQPLLPSFSPLLNISREYYERNLKLVLYWIPTDLLYRQLQWKAPDFWSYRAASYNFVHHEDHAQRINQEIQKEFEDVERPKEKLERLKNIVEEEKKRKKPGKKRIGHIITEIANTLYNLGEPEKALKFHQEALQIDRQLGYKQGEAFSQENIGTILQQPETEKAIECFAQAQKAYLEMGMKKAAKRVAKKIESIKK